MTIENASVVKVYQPDYFLWRQSFKANCACEGQERSLVVNHLPAMLRINFAKLKENSKWQKCCLCNKPMTEEVKQRVFFPCQRVDIHLPNFSNQKRNELYPLWLINDDICKLKKGDVLSAVVYYDIYVDYTLNNGRMLGAMHDFFIGYHLAKMSLSRNQKFFSELISKLGASSLVELEFLSYDIKNYDYILSRWQNVSKCLSNLSGDFLKSEIISLNFALLLSITLMNKSSLKPAIDFHSVGKFHVEKVKYQESGQQLLDQRINLFMFTDQIEIIIKLVLDVTAHLENLYIFPTVYDTNSLFDFFVKLNGGILLLIEPQRLKKSELTMITQIVKGEKVYLNEAYGSLQVNCAVWVIASEPIKQQKPNTGWKLMTIEDYWDNGAYEYFDIILDLSKSNNLIKGVQLKLDLNYADRLLRSLTNPNSRIETPIYSQILSKRAQQDQFSEESNAKNIFISNNHQAISLLQRFYGASRKCKQISIPELNSLRKIASASALLRGFTTGRERIKYLFEAESPYLEIIDVIISILLNEESAINRRGTDNAILGNEVIKFLANDDLEFTKLEKVTNGEIYLSPKDKKFLQLYQGILDFISGVENRFSNIDI